MDNINAPPHYKQGEIECITAIRAAMTADEFTGYLKGNVTKYLWRCRYKGGIEDMKKAQWYLNELVRFTNAKTVESSSSTPELGAFIAQEQRLRQYRDTAREFEPTTRAK